MLGEAGHVEVGALDSLAARSGKRNLRREIYFNFNQMDLSMDQ